jgi:hypothetical protein
VGGVGAGLGWQLLCAKPGTRESSAIEALVSKKLGYL